MDKNSARAREPCGWDQSSYILCAIWTKSAGPYFCFVPVVPGRLARLDLAFALNGQFYLPLAAILVGMYGLWSVIEHFSSRLSADSR